MYSLDNRRLAAYKLADHGEVPIDIVDINDPAIAGTWNNHFTTKDDGLSIVVRGTGVTIR